MEIVDDENFEEFILIRSAKTQNEVKQWLMNFVQYAQDGQRFVAEVASELGLDNTEQAERILTSVLHTLRDLLTPEESLHVVSQLPMMMKAIYVNGWRIHNKGRVRSMDEFIESLLLKSPRTAPQDFGNDEKAIGKYGLEKRNDRGQNVGGIL